MADHQLHPDSPGNVLIPPRIEGHALPQPFYTDPAVFDRDVERVFRRHWLFAGYTLQIPEPGDYFLCEFANESLIVIRDDDRQVHALHNSCRHRGSLLCTQAHGRVGKLVCPYHQWAYDRDGRLAGARHMGDGFDKSQYGLIKAHAQVVEGLIFICLADEPPDFAPVRRDYEMHLQPYNLERTKIALTLEYDVRANWKLVFENNRECYHCAGGHPEFCITNFDTGMPGDTRANARYEHTAAAKNAHWREHGLCVDTINFPNDGTHRCARMPLRDGCVTDSLDGKPVAPRLGNLTTDDAGSLRLISLPNAWFHALSDYFTATQLIPVDATRCKARLTWLVHEDAREGMDYDPQHVAALWRATTEQDWTLCENNQRGVETSGYRPGPYSPQTEASVEHFASWYLRQVG